MGSVAQHPYFPTSLALENYVSNERDLSSIVLSFVGMWMAILLPTWFFANSVSPVLSNIDKSIVLWFVLCGTLHTFFEGYFVLNHATFGGQQGLFAQLWKEYALSDSRYIAGDPTVLCAEFITMTVWGPMSYLTAALVLTSSPYRHPFQTIVSLGHVYGDLLYITTSLADLHFNSVSYSRPEPYYFWFYFLFLNLIWIFVPTALLYQSITIIADVFSTRRNVANTNQRRELTYPFEVQETEIPGIAISDETKRRRLVHHH